MKKTYIAPQMEMEQLMTEDDLLLAISAVGGDADIDLSGEEDLIPTEADAMEDIIPLEW